MKTTPQMPDPESLSISALLWIANDPTMMRRFLDLTGIEASDIRAVAAEPAFLAGVLKFIAGHEPTLQAFAQSANIHPSHIMKALHELPGGNEDYLEST